MERGGSKGLEKSQQPACNHPVYNRESYLGYKTGMYACTTCGSQTKH